MSILSGIKDITRRITGDAKAPEVKVQLTRSLSEQVWENPSEYNRHTRRAAGWRTPVGLLTEQHVGLTVTDDPAGLVPRYARRHMAALTGLATRRNRRHRARILREIGPRGLIPKRGAA